MRRTTITVERNSRLILLWMGLVAGASIAAMFLAPVLLITLPYDMERGASLGEAVVNNWGPVAMAAVPTAFAIWFLQFTIRDTRRTLTRMEVAVSDEGIELVSHPRWWFRGQRTTVRWDDVEVISAQRVLVAEAAGKRTRKVAREGLDLYLTRPLDDVPDFAREETQDESPIEGTSTPTYRLRIAGPGNKFAATVRRLTTAVGDVRPDLFYRGTAVDQWFVPDLPPNEPSPRLEEEQPRPLGPFTPPRLSPTEFALSTPLWLDFAFRSRNTLVGLGSLAVATASSAAIRYLPELGDSVLIALLGVLCMVPLGVGLAFFLISLVHLPRFFVHTGVVIDSEGLEVLEKRRWWFGQARGRVPWHDVQAVVSRKSTSARVASVTDKSETPATDVYIRADTDFAKPGAGLPMLVTYLRRPDSAATREFVSFPALRLRFPHVAEPTSETSAALWRDLPTEGTEPHRLPGSQLRAALYAARPDLCHGFTAKDVAPR